MLYCHAIKREQEIIEAEVKLLQAIELMQADEDHFNGPEWPDTDYSMWEMLEAVAVLAEKRKSAAEAKMKQYIWLRNEAAWKEMR